MLFYFIFTCTILFLPQYFLFPAMDILKSGTRKEELLVDKADLAKTYVLRRILNPMGTTDAIEFLISKLKQTKTNADFFDSMNT